MNSQVLGNIVDFADGFDGSQRVAICNRFTARARCKACKRSAYGGASAMGLLSPADRPVCRGGAGGC
jgi:hypothetical protein